MKIQHSGVGYLPILFFIVAFGENEQAVGQTKRIQPDSLSNLPALRTEWQNHLQFYLDSDENESSYEELSEQLSGLSMKPIEVNRATVDELTLLPFLSQSQAEAIVEYRRRHDEIKSLHELMLVYGMDRQTLQLCLPFLTLGESEDRQWHFSRRIRQQMILQSNRCLNHRVGFRHATTEKKLSDKAYRGDPWHNTFRYRLEQNHVFAAGFVLDKDAGEPYGERFPWAGDSFHYYLTWQPASRYIKQLVVGHYRLRLGCGLILNQQFSLGKNTLSSSLLSQNSRLSAHASTDEYHFFQGTAADLRFGRHWRLIPFFSVRQIDGKINADTLTSIATDGLHRLNREEARRHSAWMSVSGLHIAYRKEWFECGVNLLYTHMNKTYWRPRRAYNRHYFRGHELFQASLEYRLRRFGVEWKGETALSDNGAMSTLNLLQRHLTEDWSLLFIQRYFSHHYHQLHTSTFSESSDFQAEQGIYVQTLYHALRYLDLSASADFFRFTHAKYGIDRPSRGYELTLRGDYTRKNIACTLRYRLKKKQKNNTDDRFTAPLQNYYRHTSEVIVSCHPVSWFQVKTTAQHKAYSCQFRGTSQGYGFSQSVTFRKEDFPLSTQLQWSRFHTDDYDSRLYLSERNLLYSFQIPMVYGTGARYTAVLSIRLFNELCLDAKYALTVYRHLKNIGDGLQTIDGNRKHDLWLQCRWKF